MVSLSCILHRLSSSRVLARRLWSFIIVVVLMAGYLALYLQVLGSYHVTQQQMLNGYVPPQPQNVTLHKTRTAQQTNVTFNEASKKHRGGSTSPSSPEHIYIIPYPQRAAKSSSSNDLHFNCSNLDQITLKRKLGNGVSKQVLLGMYKEHKVAIKMVTRTVPDVTSCMKRIEEQFDQADITPELVHKCYVFPNMKLMKEILLLEQLHHPNLLQMLGYCVRSEETRSTSLQDHGVVAVYEYAVRFYPATLGSWPLRKRLAAALELADLLSYLEHSPIGSLHIADFKDAHFLLAGGQHIKLTDMDDITSLEPSCISGSSECNYGLPCIGGICPGHNAKANLDNMQRLLFVNLLQSDPALSAQMNSALGDVLYKLQSLNITANELNYQLKALMEKVNKSRSIR